MILVKRESASHWYLPDRTPFHEVERADGGGLRPVTLRDARKSGAYPSVTNIIGVLAKPGLDAWRVEQGILAALTLPREDNETDDDFARRVVSDMGEQVAKAADLGSRIHAACEVYAQSAALPENDEVRVLFEPVRTWFDSEVERIDRVETVVAHHEFGYAGTVDLVAKLRSTGDWAVIDFKTQRIKRDNKGSVRPAFYEAWPLQLEAYRQAILSSGEGMQPRDIVSVVIGSTEAVPVMPHVWPREEHTAYWNAFVNVRNLWTFLKGYCPIANGKEGAE